MDLTQSTKLFTIKSFLPHPGDAHSAARTVQFSFNKMEACGAIVQTDQPKAASDETSTFQIDDSQEQTELSSHPEVVEFQDKTAFVESGTESSISSATSDMNALQSSGAGLSSKEIIQQSAQQLVEDLNHKRKQDTEFVGDFKKSMEMNVEKYVSKIEQNLFQLYNQQSEQIQGMLHELFATLDRIASVESELSQFRNVVGSLYQEVHIAE